MRNVCRVRYLALVSCLNTVVAVLWQVHVTAGAPAQIQLNRDSSGLPYLDATACRTHHCLGFAVGHAFKEQIQARVGDSKPLQRMLRFASTKEGSSVVAALASTNQAAYPDYWQELEGLAAGSQVPLDQLLLLNLRSELLALANSSAADDCSDVLLHRPGQAGGAADAAGSSAREHLPHVLIAHNEDMTADTVGRCYFVHAKLGGVEFVAYTYPGELPSSAFGFTRAGLAFSLNAVFPADLRVPGIARNFVDRDFLSASSLEDGVARITRPGQAAGHNYNILDLAAGRLLTVETGPGGQADRKEIRNGSYFHANSYQRLQVRQRADPSSQHRLAQAAQYAPPDSIADMLEVLGDTNDTSYPIYRTGNNDSVHTLCTAVFDLQAGELVVYGGNPRQRNVTLRLPFWQAPTVVQAQ